MHVVGAVLLSNTDHTAVCIGVLLPSAAEHWVTRTVGVAGFGAGAGEHSFSTPTPASAIASIPRSIVASGETMGPLSQDSYFCGGYGMMSPLFELQAPFRVRYLPFEVLLAHGTCCTHTTWTSHRFPALDCWVLLCVHGGVEVVWLPKQANV